MATWDPEIHPLFDAPALDALEPREPSVAMRFYADSIIPGNKGAVAQPLNRTRLETSPEEHVATVHPPRIRDDANAPSRLDDAVSAQVRRPAPQRSLDGAIDSNASAAALNLSPPGHGTRQLLLRLKVLRHANPYAPRRGPEDTNHGERERRCGVRPTFDHDAGSRILSSIGPERSGAPWAAHAALSVDRSVAKA